MATAGIEGRHHDFQGHVEGGAWARKALHIRTLGVGPLKGRYRWILADIGGFWT